MPVPAEFTRRVVLQQSLVLPLAAGGVAMAAGRPAVAAPGGRVLVAYFTRTANTRLIATQIQRALDATLFRIVPAEPYPEDYREQVAQAERERQAGYEPPLAERVPDIETYGTVFLGFPIWGQTVPTVVRSFLSQHDLSDKALVPFVTHGGYGPGDSQAVLARYAPRARLAAAFVKRCDQERETLEEVTQWLGAL